MTCSGAALAATPIGRLGQGVINDGISGVQGIEKGESKGDVVTDTLAGFVAGIAGGPGYIPAASHNIAEASKAIKDGLQWSGVASVVTNIHNYASKKVKGWFSDKSQENSDAVPAT